MGGKYIYFVYGSCEHVFPLCNFFYTFCTLFPLLLVSLQKDEIVSDDVAYMQVYDPVHEIETDETHGKHDPTVFVNVCRRYAQKLVVVFLRV